MPWNIPVKEQVKLQMEITNYCNAACPACGREVVKENKKPYNLKLNSKYVDLEKFKSWLDKDNWSNLEQILFCGNYDEPATNPDLIAICDWIVSNKKLFPQNPEVTISTNGGVRNTKLWKELGELSKLSNQIKVNFAIDGFEDTNHLYRKNVNWIKLQQNWRAYINAGGIAWWQWVMFEHNEHQKHLVEQYAKQEGFRRVKFVGSWRPSSDSIIHTKDVKAETLDESNSITPNCYVNDKNSMGLYIDNNGVVVPCCWQGVQSGLLDVYEKNDGDFTQGILNGNNSIQEILDSIWMENFKKNMEQGIFAKCVQKCKKNIRNTYRYEKLI